MKLTPQIRMYQPVDLPQIHNLETQVEPYRPEDQAEVEEMFLGGPDGANIVGMAGVGHLNPKMMPPQNPYALELENQQDFVELQHLRVSPSARGHGVGSRLCQAVIDWSRRCGYKRLIVNTTTPQHPARNLYQKLGFQEKACTFVGMYELIWMEKTLGEYP